MTGGEYTLRVWEIDPNTRKLQPTECQLGQLKRVVTSIVCDDDDTNMWCGTTSGDVLQVRVVVAIVVFKHRFAVESAIHNTSLLF